MASSSTQPFFSITGARIRLWPLVLALVLMQAILIVGRETARWGFHLAPEPVRHQVWAFVFAAGVLQGCLGFLAIVFMRDALPKADSYLRRPRAWLWMAIAIAVGCAMGAAMFFADYFPQLLARGPAPKAAYDTTPMGAGGWLFTMITTGIPEETIFRGFLVGMLTVLTPGRVRLGRVDFPLSGVYVALLFGLAHYGSFFNRPLIEALAQQAYAFLWGLAYVWLMEGSDSLLIPMVAHGLSDFVEVGIVILWILSASH